MRPGVEPGGTAAEDFDVELLGLEVEAVEIGDFELAARGRFEAAGARHDGFIVEVNPGDGVIGFWIRGFFLERMNAAGGVEFDDPVAFGVGDVITENRRAGGAAGGAFEGFYKIVSVKEIITQDEGGRLAVEEADVLGDVEGLSESVGAGLFSVGKFETEVGAIAEEFFEERQISGRGDDENIADAGEHEDGQRVINHRLVVDRHELLGDCDGQREQAGAGAAGENDASARRRGGIVT